MELRIVRENKIMPSDRKRLPRPKQRSLSQPKRKKAGRLKKKEKQPKEVGAPKGDGVLFPSTRTPAKMNKKIAKKIKKARFKF